MRILVAEDEPDMAAALEAMLEREHYAVDVARDGEEALDFALGSSYDCLVLDIMMPRIDGLEVLRRLRARGIDAPVLVLSAKGEPRDRIAGLDGGADDYLPKPFLMEEFLARVRALTRRRGGFVPDAVSAGNMTLDRTTFELSTPEGGTATLSGKEFQIAELLMRHHGRYIPTAQLMQHVWGYDQPAEANALWTHMSNLRRKMRGIGSSEEITASRGRGYALVGRGDGHTS